MKKKKESDKKIILKIKQYLKNKHKENYPKRKKQTQIQDKRWVCDYCDYKWKSNKKFGHPSICPKCRKEGITKYSETDTWEKEFKKEDKLDEENLLEMAEDCLFSYRNFKDRKFNGKLLPKKLFEVKENEE